MLVSNPGIYTFCSYAGKILLLRLWLNLVHSEQSHDFSYVYEQIIVTVFNSCTALYKVKCLHSHQELS